VTARPATLESPIDENIVWRYFPNHATAFDPIVFDEQQLRDLQLIESTAAAGRGNTFFLTVNDQALVLRHFRRGGVIRKITDRRYIYTGLLRTRAFREFDILHALSQKQLPVPKPYAAQIVRIGFQYEASIVTKRLPGETFAERLLSGQVSEELWREIGFTIARFHKHAVYHADLNAHNIMVNENDGVSLIDFDRACFRTLPDREATGWCLANIARLERSILKILNGNSPNASASGVKLLKASWVDLLS